MSLTEKPRIICLCGSTRFRDEMAAERARLTLEGVIVVGPEVLVRSDPAYADLHDSEAKAELDALHLRKIDLADEVLVVNPNGYVGESTGREIRYAHATAKPVTFLAAFCDQCGRSKCNHGDETDCGYACCWCWREGRDG